ncbi:hypothetical protein Q6D67_07450 [Haliea sp. E1-2-M8]|nr:hypothetical protein [Haliea sp. E1-2-M8]MDO8861533.1 hypothetical protein [Haliea sp. E1-2-M8]
MSRDRHINILSGQHPQATILKVPEAIGHLRDHFQLVVDAPVNDEEPGRLAMYKRTGGVAVHWAFPVTRFLNIRKIRKIG